MDSVSNTVKEVGLLVGLAIISYEDAKAGKDIPDPVKQKQEHIMYLTNTYTRVLDRMAEDVQFRHTLRAHTRLILDAVAK